MKATSSDLDITNIVLINKLSPPTCLCWCFRGFNFIGVLIFFIIDVYHTFGIKHNTLSRIKFLASAWEQTVPPRQYFSLLL